VNPSTDEKQKIKSKKWKRFCFYEKRLTFASQYETNLWSSQTFAVWWCACATLL